MHEPSPIHDPPDENAAPPNPYHISFKYSIAGIVRRLSLLMSHSADTEITMHQSTAATTSGPPLSRLTCGELKTKERHSKAESVAVHHEAFSLLASLYKQMR